MTQDAINITDIFRAFYSKAAEYRFFQSAHEKFFRMDKKICLNKINKTKFILIIFFLLKWYETLNQFQENTKKYRTIYGPDNMLLYNK